MDPYFFYELFHIFLVGLFLQFQPLAPADTGATFHYEVRPGNEIPHSVLSITVEEAGSEDGVTEFVLLSDYAADDSARRWVRFSIAVSDTARYLWRIEVEDTSATDTIVLPSGHASSTLGLANHAALVGSSTGTTALPTARGDTLRLRTDTYTYEVDSGERFSVEVSPERGVVAATLELPGLDPTHFRLRPAW